MTISYKHHTEMHSLRGARAGFKYLSRYGPFHSLLDVGAGTGTWMRAAQEAGIEDVYGLDGIDTTRRNFLADRDKIQVHDLCQPFNLCRTFDCVICLEVAEHLDKSSARTLIRCLCDHGNTIFFSAASPRQWGQNHVNCQTPAYWQALFNGRGFACFDDVRWQMWSDSEIEPWYRQNIFRAVRQSALAGSEPRIQFIVHPAMVAKYLDYYAEMEAGRLPLGCYVTMAGRVIKKEGLRLIRFLERTAGMEKTVAPAETKTGVVEPPVSSH
jgi:SAM-dependent methyltransferase